MSRNPVRSMQFLLHHHVHHAQSQSRIGTRQRRNMLVSGTGGQSTNRVNNYNAGTITLSLTQKRHDMRSCTGRIATPNENEPALQQHIRSWSQASTNGQLYGFLGGMPTNSS